MPSWRTSDRRYTPWTELRWYAALRLVHSRGVSAFMYVSSRSAGLTSGTRHQGDRTWHLYASSILRCSPASM